jgi:hypothetical protein
MKYINREMTTQDRPCTIRFVLNAEKVNTIRYDSEPYETAQGSSRQFNLYMPREVFWDTHVPHEITVQFAVDLK